MKPVSILITVLIFLALVCLVMCCNKDTDDKESFKQCICSQREGRERTCQDVTTVNNLYVTGQLTENSDLKSRGWTTISPGDVQFPPSNGCGWSNASTGKGWQAWDFTDFGN